MNRTRAYEFKASSAGSKEVECWLYDEIGWPGITAAAFVNDLQKVPADSRLVLHVHSPGGSVIDGQAIFTALKNHRGGVTTKIDGLAASMAGVIAIAGSPVQIASNAMIMVHDVSSVALGSAEEMRKTADIVDKIQETVITQYVNKTKLPRQRIIDMMREETWMIATEAKELGFADEITGEVKMAAKFDLSKFKNFAAAQARLQRTTKTTAVSELSLVAQLREKLSSTRDPRERALLARRLRELRGTMLEIAATLPSLEAVRERLSKTSNPHERAILAKYARELRNKKSK
jgi:ATP-dependent protease ClpP protease subunit